ncbi:Ivy family c-type lysozyme inhibitor [Rhizobium sp. G187]|uniref:Ivy family c-type lysozyme inhibitor n=1 Tax=Rhizobium sp. G187 TaxID=3451352 RepID=UPI003EE7F6D8
MFAGPLAAQPTSTSLSGNYLPQVLAASQTHRDSLTVLIKGQPGLPFWVRSLVRQPRYVALASQEVRVKDAPMQLFRACEARRCEASWLRALFSADGKRVLLYISDDKLGIKIFGDPTPQELAFIARP